MKALFLAAGFSTRLYPLTQNFPKGLLAVANKPIISFLLNQVVQLFESGRIDEVALITNDRSYQHFHDYLTKEVKIPVQLINNQVTEPTDRLGAIGDLDLALDLLGWNDDLLVLPSDTICSVQLSKVLEFFHQNQTITNVVFDTKDTSIIQNSLGCVTLDEQIITSFTEKPAEPESSITSVPIYLYPADNLSLIKKYADDTTQNHDSPGAIIPWLLTQTEVSGYQIDGYYYDVGTIERLEQLQRQPELLDL